MDIDIGAPGPSWVPQACTLPAGDRPTRAAEFDRLFTDAVLGAERVEPARLRLELRATPQIAGRAAELVARETSCCSFFTFTLTATAARLWLDVVTTAEHAGVLDGLAGRAVAAAGPP